MREIDFDTLKFRASMMGEIMSGTGKKWNVENSLTCKRALIEMYREMRYQRRHEVTTKFMEKGTTEEENGITLFSEVENQFYKKNTERITNDFFTGEYDLYTGESTTKAETIVDIKCSWSLWTFPSILDKPDTAYIYQVQTYMALSGAHTAYVAYCLVNASMKLVDEEKKRTAWKMDVYQSGIESPEYVEACKKIERNMIFDIEQFKKEYPGYDFHEKEWTFDIPANERMIKFEVKRDESLIAEMQDRVKDAREWMKSNLSQKQ